MYIKKKKERFALKKNRGCFAGEKLVFIINNYIYIYIIYIIKTCFARRERGRVLHTSDIFIHIIHTSSSLFNVYMYNIC